MANILIVDDEERMRHLLSIMLKRKGYATDMAGDGLEAYEKLKNTEYDMVIADIKMPRMDGKALLEKTKQEKITCPFVFITAFATVDSAVEAMQLGAMDYITKPFDEDRILMTVQRTLNLSQIIAENKALKNELRLAGAGRDVEIVYVSEEMDAVVNLAGKVAKTDSAVLVHGDSGTGKELLARYIHQHSHRRSKRFVPVNCAAISANLVESELFGHEKGAYTGADKKSEGKFEFANGGTLFLDEIGDLPLEAQAKLLRALQEKKFQRVGGNEEIAVDVRVICATNRNLEDLLEKEAFRQDLYFRINVFPIRLPSLKERMTDVILLARFFLDRMSHGNEIELDESAQKTLMAYSWPGNVRELANAVERSIILARDGGVISAKTLSFLKSNGISGNGGSAFRIPPEGLSLEDMENTLVKQAMEMTGNNQSAAAKLLGLSRAKFRVLLKQAKNSA